MKLTILSIGRARKGPVPELFETYRRRLPWPMEIREFEVKRAMPEARRGEAEGALLLDAVPAGAHVAALDGRGTAYESEDFARWIRKVETVEQRDIAFLIGGASGHGEALRDRADSLLSLGPPTWPHLLVRVLLAEQIYRASSILSGHPYHKGD
ncbi:23S rRNA (pseudouridine(1915)-N(3))-methyltransferase RlmH [Oceanibacterium hippocampi]|uniref:Ribosomal RNA large subunit methyltransferase H n=1 Tax=Oceanibacterium hippocampi TaxID=745714 RepID=A0A1Y5RB75_9PROT|nr:23S rRNA (pseudouridine(1915)-N(3))-methyltransferase RlmH [Oceanibacterium hippocampi]SLN13329.1 Ribosomal RNA large subunit methyltransferase H [Oceanibacterium hippocampi]